MIQKIHSNPSYLSFCLTDDRQNKNNFEIIKKISIEIFAGTLEAAIIGSSHYLRLENVFFEILSCSIEKFENGNIFFETKNVDFFSFEKKFERFEYRFFAETKNFENPEFFKNFEQELLKTGKLVHSFNENSAITCLDFESIKDKFLFKTWHTYPEFLKVIYSETVLINLS